MRPSLSLPLTLFRHLSSTPSLTATPLPLTASGPPPSAPLPSISQHRERIDRRRRQAELLQRGQDLRASQTRPSGATMMKKRLWKDVNVKTTDEGHHTIHLDTRPIRAATTTPTKAPFPLPIPASKPHLATAIALEWDLLVTTQQALRQHLIPLTSIASRAYDISLQDQQQQQSSSSTANTTTNTRSEIVNTMMRYLDTDTLLCWAAAPENNNKNKNSIHQHSTLNPSHSDNHNAISSSSSSSSDKESLRDIQIKTAQPIISHLTTYIWPGVEINPVLDDASIMPTNQPPSTRAIIRGWIHGLGPWDLAGLERAVLAGKSLCVGARLVIEWSENFRDLVVGISAEEEREGRRRGTRFGVEEAAEACSLEVRWQTGTWGEVEDSHDVEKEDLRRQLGSVILVVSGE